ncbi:carbon-nitrogen family hydrolase [Ornithinicoccus hortensis]|uniref:Putative amidohydrolase n=1 Tax=Ornithinicoccus hortensis TaxID=82346 RepID=A0A542YNV5_9MICO|nr:carbon-nitrogen family hydrolase [Ornithinicoccus hortensis]TQL49604.1 putative amidohydrolase [Ornithinicoccus hortensis]
MKIAVIQLAYGDEETLEARTQRVADLVRAQAGHDLVVLPELWSAGGFDFRAWPERAQPADGSVVTALAGAAREIGAVLHAGSLIEKPVDEPGPEGRGMWNTSVLIGADGRAVARYRKVHRFGFGTGEPKLLEAGEDIVVVDLPAPATGLRAGLSTCYDARFPELYRAQLDRGAELFLVPAAWPAARVEAWRLLLRARAIENQCFVVACNTAGTHAGIEMGGHSAVIDPWGQVLAEAGTGEEVLSVQIDPAVVAEAREKFPVLADRRL